MKRNKNLKQKRSGSKTKNAKSNFRRPTSERNNRSRFKFSKNLHSRLKNAKPLLKNRQRMRGNKL